MSKMSGSREFKRKIKLFDRLFFGFRPDDDVRAAMIAAGDDVRQKERISTPIRAHVLHSTLLVVLDANPVTEDQIKRYETVGDRIAAQAFEPFWFVFNRASRIQQGGDPSPLVLLPDVGRRPFKAMQRAAVDALSGLGLPAPPHGLSNPHVTLLYGDGNVDRAITPIVWDVRELVLIHSLVGLGEHRLIRTWPLERAPDLFGR